MTEKDESQNTRMEKLGELLNSDKPITGQFHDIHLSEGFKDSVASMLPEWVKRHPSQQYPGTYFLPATTESFRDFASLYEGEELTLQTFNGVEGIWMNTPYNSLSPAHMRDAMFPPLPGGGDFEGETIPYRPRRGRKKESQSVKNYRNVMNGLIARVAK